MESSAQMNCAMKVNFHCDGCKKKVMEMLQNLSGMYSVAIDAEQGLVKVNGEVNPSVILGIIDKYGKHGEISTIKFDGVVKEEKPYAENPKPYVENPYIPYELPYLPPCQPLMGPDPWWYGSNHSLMPLPQPPSLLPPPLPQLLPPPPPTPQMLPPPPPPPPPAVPLPTPPEAKETQPLPAARPAPPPKEPQYPHCCSVM